MIVLTQTMPRVAADIAETMRGIGAHGREASRALAIASTGAKDAALIAAARDLRAETSAIIEANGRDLAAARDAGRPASFLDRLMLDAKRIDGVARGLEEIAALPDPVGDVIARWARPNCMEIERVRVPRNHLREPS